MAITRVSDRKVYSFKSSGTTVTEYDQRRKGLTTEAPPIGIKTPVALADRGKNFLQMHTNFADQVHDNLKNLILTNHGERLGHPQFGANLMELTFEIQEEGGQAEAMTRITKAVGRYMPYVSLENFSPVVDNFDNKEVAKIGIVIGYTVPKLRTEIRYLEVILYAAG